ncbi:acyltransferase family protein [Sphingomonas sp. ID0503]|uniref:acyltransferase family protein n=1 Tax=Sphingomonas sp. ID0503 TaxID=3399691 RepID=UPI003AFB220E
MTVAAKGGLRQRNYGLDGMRGVAAIWVVFFHASVLGLPLAPGGYLAVDFFFILSGFVVQRAYAERLRSTMSLWQFVEVRLVRLYPLFLLGLLIGLGRAAGAIITQDPRAPDIGEVLTSLVFNLFFLPTPLVLSSIFPMNAPSWSLSLEVMINLVFAIGLFRAKSRTIVVLCIAGAAGMIFASVQTGDLDVGVRWETYLGGVSRVFWGFGIGVLMGRLLSAPPSPRIRPLWLGGALLLLIAAMSAPVSPSLRPLYDVFAAIFLFPVVLLVGIRCRVEGKLAKALGALGDISYPLYAVHYPLILPLHMLLAKGGLTGPSEALLISLICVLVAVPLSLIDEAVRRRIEGWLRLRRSAPLDTLRA